MSSDRDVQKNIALSTESENHNILIDDNPNHVIDNDNRLCWCDLSPSCDRAMVSILIMIMLAIIGVTGVVGALYL